MIKNISKGSEKGTVPECVRYNNEDWKLILLNPKNIEPLESLLEKELLKKNKLLDLFVENQLNFGDYVPRKDLEETLSEVKTEVDKFLGVSDIGSPNINYKSVWIPNKKHVFFLPGVVAGLCSVGMASLIPDLDNYNIMKYVPSALLMVTGIGSSASIYFTIFRGESTYYPTLNDIDLRKEKITRLIPAIGHEYAHYVMDKSGIKTKRKSILAEGFAMGVEHYISEVFAEKENNEAFLFDISTLTLSNLYSTYHWICEKLGKNDRRYFIHDGCKVEPEPVNVYALGNALFSLAELTQGKQVYRDVLDGKFELGI